jgi:hypothetical protein
MPTGDLRAKWESAQTFRSDWAVDLSVLPRAMVKGEDKLFLAGPPDISDAGPERLRASWAGELGGTLLTISARNGSVLQETKLEWPPVWDSIAVVEGHLYLSNVNGTVQCFGGEKR